MIQSAITMNPKSLLRLLSVLWLSSSLIAAEPSVIGIRRLPGNPIIRPEMLPGSPTRTTWEALGQFTRPECSI